MSESDNIFKLYFWDVITKKYLHAQGRARRKEYWFFQLFYYLFLILLYMIPALLFDAVGLALAFILGFVLLTLAPSISLTVRRLHDVGASGAIYLVKFIPYVGGLIVLIITLLDSKPGANQYGPNPKETDSLADVFE